MDISITEAKKKIVTLMMAATSDEND